MDARSPRRRNPAALAAGAPHLTAVAREDGAHGSAKGPAAEDADLHATPDCIVSLMRGLKMRVLTSRRRAPSWA